MRQIYTGDKPTHFDLNLKSKLMNSSQHWLFYHPFDAPEYMYLEWHNLQRSALERLLGKTFEPSDLLSMREAKERIKSIPVSWQVMF